MGKYSGLHLRTFCLLGLCISVLNANLGAKKLSLVPILRLQGKHQQSACPPEKSFVTHNPATGFNLSCPCNTPANLPDGIKDVQLFYHVGMVKNWVEIVEDQLTTLERCGLGHYASSLTVSYTNGDPQELRDVLNKFKTFGANTSSMKVTLLPGPDAAPWEGTSINAIHDACHLAVTEATKKGGKTIVFYFHNKGASKYEPTWRDRLEKAWSYSRSLYWRKYMEYFTLERPGLCLSAFSDGANACGVELHAPKRGGQYPPHYSGNFWSASCQYIVQSKHHMTKLTNSSGGYIDAELWIGRGFMITRNQSPNEKRRYVGLFNRPWNLYEHLVLPEEYSINDENKALRLTSSISLTVNKTKAWDSVLDSAISAPIPPKRKRYT